VQPEQIGVFLQGESVRGTCVRGGTILSLATHQTIPEYYGAVRKGSACLNYESAYKRFPPAFTPAIAPYSTNAVNNNQESWGWNALLLPFIEQGNLHGRLGINNYSLRATIADLNPQISNSEARVLLQTPIASFQCPSDTGENQIHQQRHWGGASGGGIAGWGNWRPARSNYTERGRQ